MNTTTTIHFYIYGLPSRTQMSTCTAAHAHIDNEYPKCSELAVTLGSRRILRALDGLTDQVHVVMGETMSETNCVCSIAQYVKRVAQCVCQFMVISMDSSFSTGWKNCHFANGFSRHSLPTCF